jgi:hypothetical protein
MRQFPCSLVGQSYPERVFPDPPRARALGSYRIKVNKLMDGGQEIADGEKDRFIESLKEMFEVSRGSPPSA